VLEIARLSLVNRRYRRNAAWIAGVARDGQNFLAHVEDNQAKPKKHRPDDDVFELWIGGVAQTADGALDDGDVAIAVAVRH